MEASEVDVVSAIARTRMAKPVVLVAEALEVAIVTVALVEIAKIEVRITNAKIM